METYQRALVLGDGLDPLNSAAVSGLRRQAWSVEQQALSCFAPAQATARGFDAVVVCGHGVRARAAMEFFRRHSVPVFDVALGWLQRDEPQYRIGERRWPIDAEASKRLGVQFAAAKRRPSGAPILLCGPGHDAPDSRGWWLAAVPQLGSAIPGPIIWCGVGPAPVPGLAEGIASDLIGTARLVVDRGTRWSLKALVRGVPVVMPGSGPPHPCRDLAGRVDDLKAVAHPGVEAVKSLCAELAASQFTLSEIASGAPFEGLADDEAAGRPEESAAPVAPGESVLLEIAGVGPATVARLAEAGIENLADLAAASVEVFDGLDLGGPARQAIAVWRGEEDGTT